MSSLRSIVIPAFVAVLLGACGDGDDGSTLEDHEVAGAFSPSDPLGRVRLPSESLFPEGISMATDGTMYVGSIANGSIIRLTPGDSKPTTLAAAGVLERKAVGMAVDEDRGLLWVCDSNPFKPTASSLVGIDLADGRLVVRHPIAPLLAEGVVFGNDVVLDDKGNLFVTDSFGGRVLRVAAADAQTDGSPAQPWLENALLKADGEPSFGANGIVVLAGHLYVANFNQGSIVQVAIADNGDAGSVAKVALRDGEDREVVLAGPDGLAVTKDGTLLVVENAIFKKDRPHRLTAIRLRADPSGTTGETRVLSTRLDAPTTVAVHGEVAWVVESQFEHLFGIDETQPSYPFEVSAVLLQ